MIFFSLYYIGVGPKVCVGLNVCVDLLLALFIHFISLNVSFNFKCEGSSCFESS